MHQHKVFTARPKIEKGKKLFEPSFTLFLAWKVGPGFESTYTMQLEHGLELQDRQLISLGNDKSMTSLTQAPRKGYCESQRAALSRKTQDQRYSDFLSSKSSQAQERPKSFRNRPGNKPQVTRDPQTFLGWIHWKTTEITRLRKERKTPLEKMMKDWRKNQPPRCPESQLKLSQDK